MVGVWCGIVVGGGISTGVVENNQFSGWGICVAWLFWCGAGGGDFLAGENMNGRESWNGKDLKAGLRG